MHPALHRHATCAVALLATLAALCTAAAPASAAPGCSARSTAVAPRVVELYTSEGCSSCPPADRWLSQRVREPGTVALAFHVDYWDRLGWTDRFASPAHTQRQAQQQSVSGARFSYTPQVIVDGIDRPDWSRANLAAPTRGNAPVQIALAGDGRRTTATVTAEPHAPARLAAYWAVTEDGHASAVRAGENAGATLQHDVVVRQYRPVAAWAQGGGAPVTLSFENGTDADPAHPRRVNLVVVDAATGRPVQALGLGC